VKRISFCFPPFGGPWESDQGKTRYLSHQTLNEWRWASFASLTVLGTTSRSFTVSFPVPLPASFCLFVSPSVALSSPLLSSPVLSSPLLSCPLLSCPLLSCPLHYHLPSGSEGPESLRTKTFQFDKQHSKAGNKARPFHDMTVVPVSQSILGFTGGVLSSMTAYSLVSDQLRNDARALDNSLQRFRRTIEYGLPLFIRDEVF